MSFACKQALAFVLTPSSRRPPPKTEENKSAENKPEQAPSAKTNNQVDGTVQAGEGGSEGPEQSVAGGAEQSFAGGAEQSFDEVAEHPREAGDDGEEEIMNIAPPWDMNQEEVRKICSHFFTRHVYLFREVYLFRDVHLFRDVSLFRDVFVVEPRNGEL